MIALALGAGLVAAAWTGVVLAWRRLEQAWTARDAADALRPDPRAVHSRDLAAGRFDVPAGTCSRLGHRRAGTTSTILRRGRLVCGYCGSAHNAQEAAA